MTAATACSQVQVRGRSCEGVSLIVRTASGERTIDGSNILVAAGRIPNTADGLENAGVAGRARLCPRQERLETSAPDVWALDECAGSPQFTHISEGDFRIVTENLAGGKRSTRDRLVPYCVFADPPLAHVGLSERDAERQGCSQWSLGCPLSCLRRSEAHIIRAPTQRTLRSNASDAYLAFTPARSLSIARVSLVSALPPWQVSSSSASASGFA